MRQFLVLFILLQVGSLCAQDTPDNSRLIIHLLDYMANDYGRAVENGEVVNEFEYAEMQEFATTISQMVDELMVGDSSQKAQLLKAAVLDLDSSVGLKETPERIAQKASEIKKEISSRSKLSMSPNEWPDLENGQRLYSQNCVSCHGSIGDGKGPSAAGLNPQPSALNDPIAMGDKAPIEAYHTVKFGVEGTSMAPFLGLSDKELWEVAFYVHTLRFKAPTAESTNERISLEELASSTDLELSTTYSENSVAYWRQNRPNETKSVSPLDKALQLINKGLELVKKGEYKAARSAVLSSYLEGIEPIELSLMSLDPTLVQNIELEMGALRKLIDKEASYTEIEKQSQAITPLIAQAKVLLSEKESSFWITFSLAASVILREGLEAFLVIIIILSILKRANAQGAARWVHAGWATAVLLGFAGWFFTGWLLDINGMQRELLEGVVALIAVAFLFYIGFWMHGKTEAKKWNDFVKNKIQNLINRESRFGLALLSFLVVFREAFESVLFLSAINLEEGAAHQSAIGLGVGSAFVAVGVLAIIMLKFSARIPISQLFKVSSLLIAVLSVILVGKGFHALQEAGFLGISAAPINIRVGLLGIYPTIETLTGQLGMVLLTIGAWRFMNRKK